MDSGREDGRKRRPYLDKAGVILHLWQVAATALAERLRLRERMAARQRGIAPGTFDEWRRTYPADWQEIHANGGLDAFSHRRVVEENVDHAIWARAAAEAFDARW